MVSFIARVVKLAILPGKRLNYAATSYTKISDEV